MSIILTGGAGFIGSCILRKLNDMGIQDIIVTDNIASTEKWRNLTNKKFLEYVHKDNLSRRISEYENITHVIHMGACTSTTETDFDYLYSNNFEYSKMLWQYCAERQISFIYASSAATYGSGVSGFSDENDIDELLPLNGYGYSKQLFDIWTKKQIQKPAQYVGLKFFNVYGPNEYHKRSMASVIYHGYRQIKETKAIRLFKSYNPRYADGGQLRDFIYVKDICDIVEFFFVHPELNGLFNAGTGKAESFGTLGGHIFEALGIAKNIDYIDMPEELKDKYQYFTEAATNKLLSAGYGKPFHSLKSGIFDYVQNYLEKDFGIF